MPKLGAVIDEGRRLPPPFPNTAITWQLRLRLSPFTRDTCWESSPFLPRVLPLIDLHICRDFASGTRKFSAAFLFGFLFFFLESEITSRLDVNLSVCTAGTRLDIFFFFSLFRYKKRARKIFRNLDTLRVRFVVDYDVKKRRFPRVHLVFPLFLCSFFTAP